MSSFRPVRGPACVLVALLMLVVAPRAPAQEAAASKALKAAAKLQLKELKVVLAAIVADFDAEVDAFENSAQADGAMLVLVLSELGTAWNDAQAAARDAVVAQHVALANEAFDALAALQDEVPVELGVYPAGFTPGDGGPFDVFDKGWRKALDKARAKMEARMVKARKPLEKQGGLAFTVRTRLPRFEMSMEVNAGGGQISSSTASAPAFGIDLLLALDPIDTDDDAIVVLAGACVAFTTLDVELSSLELGTFGDDTVGNGNHRWMFVSNALHEGNYKILVQHGTDSLPAQDSFGVG